MSNIMNYRDIMAFHPGYYIAEIIEDIPDIFGIKISLDVPKKIKRAYLGVTGEELNITEEEDGKQTVTVPKLNCHASVVFEY